MANEFRVKNGLIVDEVSNGAGVLTIADSDISSDDGSIAITVVDGQSVTIGKEGDHANIIVTPHNAAGEKITVLNTTGTDDAAIKLNAVAGGIDVDAAKAIALTTTGAAGDISLVTAHTAGVAFHIDATAHDDSEVQIDAGILDIDVTGAGTLDTGGALTLTSGADLTLDAVTDIILDANGADIYFKDDTTTTHHFFNRSSISEIQFGYNAEVSPIDTGTDTAGRTLEIAGGDTTAGTDDDIGGGSLTLRGGYGKGAAAGGSVTLAVASRNGASTGSSLNNTRDAFISISGTDGSIVLNDSLAGTTVQSADLTLAPKGGVTGQNSVVDFTLGDASNSNYNADRRILYATSEATFRAALNLDGSGSMSVPIWELGVGGTVTGNTTTALPTQAEYTTAATSFAFGAQGSVYRIGSDDATSGQVLTFDGTEWLAEDVSGTGDVSASSNFGTDNVLIRSDGTSKGVQATGISIADTSNNMSGVGSIGSKQIAIAPANDAGVAALLITPIDTNQHGIDINSSIIDANVLDITANATTTGHVINIGANGLTGTGGFMKMASTGLTVGDGGTSALMDMVVTNASVGSQTSYGMSIDYNKSGITASGKTAIVAGLAVDVDDAATNVGTATIYGGIFTSNSANAGGTITNIGVYATAGGGDSNYAGIFEAGNVGIGTSTPDHTLEIASSSADQPVLAITNTNAGTSSGELRFNKDTSSGDDNDVMGMISFYGTDAGEATHERLAYIDAVVTDSAAGSEAASIRFFVAENDATLTQGLVIAGQADNDGEVDVTIGAGAGSTVTIPGNLTVTGTTTTVHVETTTTSSGIIFEGTTGDGHDGTLTSSVADADVTYTLPNLSGHVALFAVAPTGTISSTPAELNLLDTAVADTVVASKAVIYGSGGEIAASALTVDSIEVDGKVITMTGDTSDTVTMTAAANGEFTLATVDGGGAAGHMNLDADGKIVLNTADNEHIVFEQAGVDFLSIGQGTTDIANIADSAGATAIDVFDCTVYQAVKYLILVEDITSNDYMTAELLVLGDNIPSDAVPYMTIYAVIYNSTELGTFSATGSGDNITLKYDPTEIGSKNHKVRVVAQRISALS